MTRLREKRRQARHRPGLPLLRRWTIQRATGTGAVCALAAILIAGLFDPTSATLIYPYVLLVGATALCGASILLITARDMRTRGTSGRMRPIRGFDLAVGLVLLVPSLYALSQVWPALER